MFTEFEKIVTALDEMADEDGTIQADPRTAAFQVALALDIPSPEE